MQARPSPTLAQLLALVRDRTDPGAAQQPDGVTVVIARDRAQLARLQCDQAGFAPGTLHTFVGRRHRQLAHALTGLPPISLVLDTRSARGPQQGVLFEAAYFVLDTGARWVACLEAGADESDETEPTARPEEPAKQPLLVRLANSFVDAQTAEDIRPRWRTHQRSTEHVVLTSELVSFTKGRRHLVKLRDVEALTLLPRREPGLEVREVVGHEPATLSTKSHVHHGSRVGEPAVPAALESPRLSLRRYDGRLTLPVSTVAYHERSLLPDSFRWHLSDVPTAAGLRDTGERYARLKTHAEPQHLPGSYYHFGYNNPGHFGHLMTEALAKLWGWDAAKADDPSLKILCRLHPDRPKGPADRLETLLLPAYGIDPDDIAWADGPVTVDTLYAATPMWHNTAPFYAHRGLLDDWARLGDGLTRDVGVTPGPERVFVTRRSGNRPCHNVEQVEALFEEQGFTVALTGHLPLAEQVALFGNARVVAGFGGAGMFNLAYARKVESVVVLNQWAYEARNEQLFAAAHGAACHTFWSAPDVEHPERGSLYEAHQSAWSFDLGMADELRAVLAGL